MTNILCLSFKKEPETSIYIAMLFWTLLYIHNFELTKFFRKKNNVQTRWLGPGPWAPQVMGSCQFVKPRTNSVYDL